MEQQLKQRLVGLAVIFSLAVIFVPMLLDGPGPESEALDVDIPPSPEIIPLPVKVEEQVIELRRDTDAIEPLQPRIVDEISDPPATAVNKADAGEQADDQKQAETTVAAKEPEVAAAAQPESKPATKPEAKPEPAPRPEPQAAPAPTRAEAKPLPAKPAPKPAGGDSFIVQLGSFTDKAKAYRLRDRVRKLKLGAVFIEKFAKGKTVFYRVRVGPFITRDKAAVVLNKLRAKYNIKGQVMSYDR